MSNSLREISATEKQMLEDMGLGELVITEPRYFVSTNGAPTAQPKPAAKRHAPARFRAVCGGDLLREGKKPTGRHYKNRPNGRMLAWEAVTSIMGTKASGYGSGPYSDPEHGPVLVATRDAIRRTMVGMAKGMGTPMTNREAATAITNATHGGFLVVVKRVRNPKTVPTAS